MNGQECNVQLCEKIPLYPVSTESCHETVSVNESDEENTRRSATGLVFFLCLYLVNYVETVLHNDKTVLLLLLRLFPALPMSRPKYLLVCCSVNLDYKFHI